MSLVWKASLTLSLMATAALAVVLGVVVWNDGLAILPTIWDETLWLVLPPVGCLLAVWLGRHGRTPVPPVLLAASTATAVALAGGVVLVFNGRGYLGTPWRIPAAVTAFKLMAVPAALTLAAVAAVVRGRWRRPVADEAA